VFIHYDVEKDLVTVDGAGNVVDTVTIVGSARTGAWLDVDPGLDDGGCKGKIAEH
jgi:hypothetical protein